MRQLRQLRRALLWLGMLGGLLAMHGLAPTGGTDVLAAGPHEHAAVLFTPNVAAHSDPRHAAPMTAHSAVVGRSGPAVTGEAGPGHTMPDPAPSGTAAPDPAAPDLAASGSAAPATAGALPPDAPGHGGHGGHGSHMDESCLAVLTAGAGVLLVMAALGHGQDGGTVLPTRGRAGPAAEPSAPRRPPDRSQLCVLRV